MLRSIRELPARWGLLLGLVGVVVACRFAFASTVTAPTVTPAPGGTHDITWRVTPEPGEDPIFDFHLLTGPRFRPCSGAQLRGPGDSDGVNVSGWTSSRTAGGANAGYNFYDPTRNGAIDADGFTFTIRVPEGRYFMYTLRWRTTRDGDGDPDDPVGEGEVPVPVKGTTTPTDRAEVGGPTAIVVRSTEYAVPYEVVAVGTQAGAPDPMLGWNDFKSWASRNPVPAEWNLRFENMTGTLDAQGASSAPRVVVPNDPALAGRVFYVVVAARNEENPDDWIASEITAVIITAQ